MDSLSRFSTDADTGECQKVRKTPLSRVNSLSPSAKACQVLPHHAGRRPGRTGAWRLESPSLLGVRPSGGALQSQGDQRPNCACQCHHTAWTMETNQGLEAIYFESLVFIPMQYGLRSAALRESFPCRVTQGSPPGSNRELAGTYSAGLPST